MLGEEVLDRDREERVRVCPPCIGLTFGLYGRGGVGPSEV